MSNPIFKDGRLKIGKSKSDPSSLRKDELYSTGVPEPFKIEYYAFVENYDAIEKKIHRIFHKERPNKSREFFIVSVPQAILKIRQNSIIKYEEVFFKSNEEIEQEAQKAFQRKKEMEETIKINKEAEERQFQKERQIIDIKRQEFIKKAMKKDTNIFYDLFRIIVFTSITLVLIIIISFFHSDDLWIFGGIIFFSLWIYSNSNINAEKKDKAINEAKIKFPYPNKRF